MQSKNRRKDAIQFTSNKIENNFFQLEMHKLECKNFTLNGNEHVNILLKTFKWHFCVKMKNTLTDPKKDLEFMAHGNRCTKSKNFIDTQSFV